MLRFTFRAVNSSVKKRVSVFWQRALCGRVVCLASARIRCPSSHCPSVKYSCFTQRNICVFNGGISMKLGANIHHVSGHCWKRFSRSEVKGKGDSETRCTFAAAANILMLWHQGLPVLVCSILALSSGFSYTMPAQISCTFLWQREGVWKKRGLYAWKNVNNCARPLVQLRSHLHNVC